MTTILAGTYPEHGGSVRVELNVRLEPVTATETKCTITHEPIPAGSLRLAIMAYLTQRGRDIGGGQSLDAVRAILAHGTPAMDRVTLHRLLTYWEAWHLNDTRPGCAHQSPEWRCTFDGNADTRETLRRIVGGNAASIPADPCGTLNGWPEVRRLYGEHPYPHTGTTCHKCGRHRWDEPSDACPESGYRWGTSWLYAPLPDDVVTFIRSL